MPNPHLIENPAAARSFVLGGNSRFTLVSKKTGGRFTYRAKADADGERWYISVLTGSDNESDYEFLGTVFANHAFRHGRKTRVSESAPSAAAFRWTWEKMLRNALPVEFWHEGRCCRCNRVLTDPASIVSGIGPECAKK